MIEDILHVLEYYHWDPLPEGPVGYPVYVKKEHDKGYAVVVVDGNNAGDLTKEMHQAILAWAAQVLVDDGCTETAELTLFVTSELAKFALLGEGTAFWIVTPAGRIIVRMGQPEDFCGLRADLSKTLAPEPATIMSKAPGEVIAEEKVYRIEDNKYAHLPTGFWAEAADGFTTCYFTIALIIINVLIFAVSYAAGGTDAIDESWERFASSWDLTITEHQFYRMFTCMFLHYDLYHLISNMEALLVIGYFLERRISRRAYVVVYFAGGLVGSIASLLYHGVFVPEKEVWNGLFTFTVSQRGILSAGASGAIMALAGATFFRMFIGRSFDGYWSAERKPYLDMLVFISVIINIGTAFFVEEQGNVDVSCHVGGILGGFAVMSAVMVILYQREQRFEVMG